MKTTAMRFSLLSAVVAVFIMMSACTRHPDFGEDVPRYEREKEMVVSKPIIPIDDVYGLLILRYEDVEKEVEVYADTTTGAKTPYHLISHYWGDLYYYAHYMHLTTVNDHLQSVGVPLKFAPPMYGWKWKGIKGYRPQPNREGLDGYKGAILTVYWMESRKFAVEYDNEDAAKWELESFYRWLAQ